MDGPNVNLSFEDKLTQKLSEVDTSFLKLGSCLLHPVHSAFQKGIKQVFQGQVPSVASNSKGSGELPKKKGTFDLYVFFTDIHSFFKFSSARREDYTSLESVNGVVAEYAKKHAETLWVSMKYVAVRCLEQWPNLKEDFLKFLPKQNNFKREIENTARYTRLKTCFADPTMEAYVIFVAFVAQDFEAFLVSFQSKDPMIHLLYPAMLSLLCGLQRKFIRGAKLSSEDLGENIRINVNAEKNVKPTRMIDVGTRAKTMFAQSMISDEGQEKFRKGCLKLFQVSVSYLQQKLPFDVNLMRNAQFLNPVKRKAGGATSAIPNLALKVTSVLENVLGSIFQMESKHAVVDAIRNQWHFFQNEEIPEEWYANQQAEKPTSSRHQESYWARAREECGVDSTLTSPACFVRIDHFWRRIGNLVDEFGASVLRVSFH